jgi:hypothetical protein
MGDHDFVPIVSVYRPIGLLYRPIADDICVTCGLRKADHDNQGDSER